MRLVTDILSILFFVIKLFNVQFLKIALHDPVYYFIQITRNQVGGNYMSFSYFRRKRYK